MKQKKINNILYVFQTTPYEITEDTDAQIIKVQEESYPGFVELNKSLEDKLVKYNYKVICIDQLEWMPYINEPDPTEYTLFIGGNYSEYTIKVNDGEPAGPTGRIDGLQSGDVVTFTPSQDKEYYTVSENLVWNQDISAWQITMGNEDVGVQLEYTAPAHTVVLTAPYDLDNSQILPIFDEALNGWVDMKQDSEDPTLEKGDVEYGKTYSVEQRTGIGAGKTVEMSPNYLTGEQGTVGAAFTIPDDGTAANCTITLTTQKQDPELAWSANSATVDINNIQGYPTLSNPHSVTVTYSSSSPEIASINATNGAIVANQNGNTTISAIFAGDETYNASTVSYDLTVEGGGGESGSSDDQ